jgi:hypothetical protein
VVPASRFVSIMIGVLLFGKTGRRAVPVYRAFRAGPLPLISATLPGAFRAGCVSEAAGFRASEDDPIRVIGVRAMRLANLKVHGRHIY